MKSLYIILLTSAVAFCSCNGNKDQGSIKQNGEETENVIVNDSLQQTDADGNNIHYKKTHGTIKGYVKNGMNADVILDQLDIGQINPLQSVVVDQNGVFTFDFDIPEPGIYQIRIADKNIHLFLRGGTVEINTDINNIGSYSIIGSPESQHLKEMYLILSEMNNKTYQIQDRIEKLKKDKSKVRQLLALVDSQSIYTEANLIEKSQRLSRFIDRIDTSMVGLLAAMYLDAYENYDFIIKTRNRFENICPHSKIYKQLDEKISQIVPVGPGKMAPNTVIDDMNGKSIHLSDYVGKTVLVYFWTSYNEDCRAENLEIKSVFDKHHSRGFEVFAISLDENKEEWKRAIKEDNISAWINVSNLLGWEDEVTAIYNIGEAPYLILIDKTGKIVARGFRPQELPANILKFTK